MTRKLRSGRTIRPHPGQTEETRACSVKLFANRRTDNGRPTDTEQGWRVQFYTTSKALIPVTA
uniref:Uncharacterized protein n=1 Tax=Anguilla anguilla TaxID=7936 RepID=A0A0E9VMQ1_ANGAN